MSDDNTTKATAAIEPLWSEERLADEINRVLVRARVAGSEFEFIKINDAIPIFHMMTTDYEADRHTANAQHEQLLAERDALAAKVVLLEKEVLGLLSRNIENVEIGIRYKTAFDSAMSVVVPVLTGEDTKSKRIEQLEAQLAQAHSVYQEVLAQVAKLAAVKAGRWEPVVKGIFWQHAGSDEAIIVGESYSGVFMRTTRKGEPGVDVSLKNSFRLCRLVPGQDTQPGDGQEGAG